MTQKYCSIDLEFTGFDPEKEQILEIGFAFFEASENGLKVTETWGQVFRPTIEVHQKILGLTGITQEEIDSAPSIGEYIDFLSEKLQDVVIVAHNPTLDIKFLEMAGVKLSGKSIDTLELVQFLLPTHHSYNLENLMHYFGIKHAESHRALADCLSTITLLEKMIAIHNSFPQPLKDQLHSFIELGNFSWKELLQLNISHDSIEANDSLSHDELANDQLPSVEDKIIIDRNFYLHESRVARTLQDQDGRWLLTMRNKQEVLKLWRAGLVEGVFESKDLFNENNFEQFKVNAQSPEEYRFILKVIVWLHTNWQTKTILDLNLSFFGGQFKNFINGGEYKVSDAQIVACDFRTLLSLSELDVEVDRNLLVCDMQRFEYFITHNSTERISWNSFNYVLRSIYNPETELGQAQFSKEVIDSLSAVDLFFGLVQITLRKHLKDLDYIALSSLRVMHSVFYNRLQQAANNLTAKLQSLSEAKGFDVVLKFAHDLNTFFEDESNIVKWIELNEENVVLHSQPIEIKDMVQQLVDRFKSVRYTDTLIQKPLLFYLTERLGIDPEVCENIKDFVSIEIDRQEVDINDPSKVFQAMTTSDFPVVMVFSGPTGAKSFYKDHFVSLSNQYRLFAQEYSGSGNKIFRNFRIFPNALLLATSQFINKQKYTAPSGTVIYLTWPKTDELHPYISAILEHYGSVYPELVKTLNFNDFIFNLKQLSGKNLPKILVSNNVPAEEINF